MVPPDHLKDPCVPTIFFHAGTGWSSGGNLYANRISWHWLCLMCPKLSPTETKGKAITGPGAYPMLDDLFLWLYAALGRSNQILILLALSLSGIWEGPGGQKGQGSSCVQE